MNNTFSYFFVLSLTIRISAFHITLLYHLFIVEQVVTVSSLAGHPEPCVERCGALHGAHSHFNTVQRRKCQEEESVLKE